MSVIQPAAVTQLDEELIAELRLLVANPTAWDLAEGVPEEAQEALDRWDRPTPKSE